MPIVDPLRVTDWTYTGIPGGIPENSTVFQTLSSSATAAQITTAIANCPENQVVELDAGTFNLGNNSIRFASNRGVTLRGAGTGQTILNFTKVGGACIDTDQYAWTGAANIASGYTKGSTAVVMSGAVSGSITTGSIILIDQDDDTALVMTSGSPARRMNFMHRVTSVVGTTINFTPPLAYALSAGLTPKVSHLDGNFISNSGIENLTIENTGPADYCIYFYTADRCWFKNVEINGVSAEDYGIFLPLCIQCEVRKCYIHDAVDFPNQNGSFAVYLYTNSSWNLVEDCIFDRLGAGVFQTGASCNCVIYNYCGHMMFQGFAFQTGGYNSNHGAYPMMSLWEGNSAEQFQNDGYHGSAGYQTTFRNWFSGVSLQGNTGNKKMISLERGSYFCNSIGDVLGCSWGAGAWTGPGTFNYEMTGQPGYTDQSVIYRLGYPNVGNNATDAGDVAVTWPLFDNNDYPDANVEATIYRHGSYDTKNAAQVWDAGNADHDIPESLRYSSKPDYFGICPWPPFDPADPTASDVTNIPAGYRFVNGVDPPPSGDTVLNTTNLTTTNLVIG